MIDGTLVEELSATPSSQWPELIRRHYAVTEYLKQLKSTTADVDYFAADLGMSRRMFYRLIARRREQHLGCTKPKASLSRGSLLSPEQRDIITEAIASVPAGSACKDIIAEVSRLSLDRQVAVPSDFAIISRYREGSNPAGLQARLAADCPLIIDACSTDLDLKSTSGPVVSAWVLALIEKKTGVVVTSTLVEGSPDVLSVAKLLVAAHDHLKGRTDKKKEIGVTAALADAVERVSSIPAQSGFGLVRLNANIRSGEALHLLFGQQLGRISLRPRPRRGAKGDGKMGNPFHIAEAVVSHLVANHNLSRHEHQR